MTTTPATTIRLASGQTREVAYDVGTDYPILGVDAEGRVVRDMGGYTFALTLCCDAFDKGCEDGVYCRACYGEKSDDIGVYDPTVNDPAVSVTVR